VGKRRRKARADYRVLYKIQGKGKATAAQPKLLQYLPIKLKLKPDY
jgi:hypothetical protein